MTLVLSFFLRFFFPSPPDSFPVLDAKGALAALKIPALFQLPFHRNWINSTLPVHPVGSAWVRMLLQGCWAETGELLPICSDVSTEG